MVMRLVRGKGAALVPLYLPHSSPTPTSFLLTHFFPASARTCTGVFATASKRHDRESVVAL